MPNFRDAGGCPTSDGRRVRAGRLYRANALSGATPEDARVLSALGIARVFDLRSSSERAADPTLWAHSTLVTRVFAPRNRERRLAERALDYSPDVAGARALMIDAYTALPRALAPALELIFHEIAEGALPCIVHCAIGKDRTGVAIALILAALGAKREAIRADYELTNRFFISPVNMARAMATGPTISVQERFPPEATSLMLAADPAYLDAAFAAVAEEHGGIRGYVRDMLRVTDATLTRMKERLLEPLPLSTEPKEP
ncbi:tyrosine-protein phosphatase [Sphingomonas bacterium]|uniref:tyrosine-protein phosphatase n=1 Tax=Sphingomonas bacterium TaxID=1895847 RepID=UPI0020C714AB|nr:tyrosine-protein phosphatase [Sphingomonas bacterium]